MSTPESVPADPTPPRRRFTPAERIANREAEIERIKEKQRERVREMIAEAIEALQECGHAAKDAGMAAEAKLCAGAYAVMANPDYADKD